MSSSVLTSPIFAAPMPVTGTSCGGNIQWELVDGTGNVVDRASEAQRVRVCQSGFASPEAVTANPYQGYTFEVSWAELNPFRQRIAGATVFYNEDFAPSNLSEMIVQQGNLYRVCTDYFVAEWAHDTYCDGSNVLGGCMNNFNLTCNENAQRYWRQGQEPFDNTWSDILIPAATGGNPASTDNRQDVMNKIADFSLCEQVPGNAADSSTQRGKCVECLNKAGTNEEGDVNAIYTAVGCVRTGSQGLTEDIVRVFMGMVGGIALFSIISASFLFTTSQGDTNKVKQAKELLTAAVSGLFFIVFSIFILQFIGVNILGIPGLS